MQPKSKNERVPHTVDHNCQYVVIICTFQHMELLRGEITETIHQELHKAATSWGELLAVEIRSASVKMTLLVDPSYDIHRIVRSLKSASANVVRSQYAEELRTLRTHALWKSDYYVRTVGVSDPDNENAFIESSRKERRRK